MSDDMNSRSPVTILIGNPGVGKSSIGNALLGRNAFKSAISYDGRGVTIENQQGIRVRADGQQEIVMDTPGLADIERSKRAAECVSKALKQRGRRVKVNFVVQFTDGRLRPSDVTMIKTVLNAVDQDFEFGILINKIVPQLMRHVLQNTIFYRDLLTKIIGRAPAYLEFVEHESEMFGKTCSQFSPEDIERIRRFFDNQAGEMIPEENVGEVEMKSPEEYEALVNQEREKQNKLMEEFAQQKDKYDEMEKKLREEMRTFREKSDQAYDDLDKKTSQQLRGLNDALNAAQNANKGGGFLRGLSRVLTGAAKIVTVVPAIVDMINDKDLTD